MEGEKLMRKICSILLSVVLIANIGIVSNAQEIDNLGNAIIEEAPWEFIIDNTIEPEPIKTLVGKDQESVYFEYDDMNRRIKKIHNEDVTSYIYRDNLLVNESDELGNTVCYSYIKNANVTSIHDEYILEYIQIDSEKYSVTYEDDSVKSISDSQGNIIALYQYDESGNNSVYEVNSVTGNKVINESKDFIGNINPFRFQGMYYDIETGCYYRGNGVYYNPNTMEFISNPYSFTDEFEARIRQRDIISDIMTYYQSVLNSNTLTSVISEVSQANWNSGKRWYDALPYVETTARLIYAEAGVGNAYGRKAVAWVLLNRVDKKMATSIYGATTAKSQFSSINPGALMPEQTKIARNADGSLSSDFTAFKEAILYSCALYKTLTSSYFQQICPKPAYYTNQLHFIGLTSCYDDLSSNGGKLYYNGKEISDASVPGYIGNVTNKSSLSAYSTGYKYNLFFNYPN